MMDAPRPQPPLRDGKALPRPQDHVVARDADIAEFHLPMAIGRVVFAKGRQHPLDRDARRVQRHDDHGMPPVRAAVGRADAHEDADARLRVPHTRRPPLGAVQHQRVPVLGDRRGDVLRVRTGHRGFGHEEHRPDLALEQRGQPARLLFGGAEHVQHFHVAGVGGVAVEQFGRPGIAPHDLGQGGVFQHRQARAVLGIGQEQVPQPRGARTRLEFGHDGRDLPAAEIAARIQAPVLGPIGGIVGDYMRVKERLNARDHLLRAGAGGKIHRAPPVGAQRSTLRPAFQDFRRVTIAAAPATGGG